MCLVCPRLIRLRTRPSARLSGDSDWGRACRGRGVRKGGQGRHETPPPRKFPCWKNKGFLLTLQWLLAYMSSATGGFAPRPPPGLCPRIPLGDFCPQSPCLFCPPPKQISGYDPVQRDDILSTFLNEYMYVCILTYSQSSISLSLFI